MVLEKNYLLQTGMTSQTKKLSIKKEFLIVKLRHGKEKQMA